MEKDRNALVFPSPGSRRNEENQTEDAPKGVDVFEKNGINQDLEQNDAPILDSLYLGHSWATVADKHYNAFDGQPYQPLD